MDKDYLILKHASASRPSGEWSDDDFDVLYNGVVVGRIMKAAAVPVGQSWMWTLAFGHHEDRTPTHGYAATREAAMAAFAKSCGVRSGPHWGRRARGRRRQHRARLEEKNKTATAGAPSLPPRSRRDQN